MTDRSSRDLLGNRPPPFSAPLTGDGRYRDLTASVILGQMFSSSRMTGNQSSLLYGPMDELHELAFIERPIRRSLKVTHTCCMCVCVCDM